MTKDEIKNKMQVGDYSTLSAMLDCTVEAARKRINREDDAAMKAAIKIIKTRENLIKGSKSK